MRSEPSANHVAAQVDPGPERDTREGRSRQPTEGVPSPRDLFSNFVAVWCWLAMLVLVFSHQGRHFYFAELMGNFQLQLGLAACGVWGLALLRQRRRSALLLGCVIAWTLWQPLSPYVWRWGQPPVGATSLRFMTYNIYAGNHGEAQIVAAIEAERPDVLLILEYTNLNLELKSYLSARYPHHVEEPRFHGFGIGLFSRYPITASQVEYLTVDESALAILGSGGKDDPAVFATLDVDGRPLNVVGAHFFNPIEYERYPLRNRQMRRAAELIGKWTGKEAREPSVTSRSDRSGGLARSVDAPRVAAALGGSATASSERDSVGDTGSDGERVAGAKAVPTVMAGDFNCTPWSHFFRQLQAKTGLRDSRNGFGYHGSWPDQSWLLSIPIDQVLVSPDIHVHDRRVGDSGGSDHYPIIVDLSF